MARAIENAFRMDFDGLPENARKKTVITHIANGVVVVKMWLIVWIAANSTKLNVSIAGQNHWQSIHLRAALTASNW